MIMSSLRSDQNMLQSLTTIIRRAAATSYSISSAYNIIFSLNFQPQPMLESYDDLHWSPTIIIIGW